MVDRGRNRLSGIGNATSSAYCTPMRVERGAPTSKVSNWGKYLNTVWPRPRPRPAFEKDHVGCFCHPFSKVFPQPESC